MTTSGSIGAEALRHRSAALARLRARSSTLPQSSLGTRASSVAQPLLATERERRMELFVEEVWRDLEGTGVSWLGFYLDVPDAPDEERLVLGPRRPKPACSPIGIHGACGRSLSSGQPLIVDDVRDLGANYVACDPRDQSELVIPCFDADSKPWAVLDLDSHELRAFGAEDLAVLSELLRGWGLTA